MTIDEFLDARIAEDEAAAEAAIDGHFEASFPWTDVDVLRHIERWSSARVLTECAAKRAIVRQLKSAMDDPWTYEFMARDLAEETLFMMARPWAEHPDFSPAWTV
jgi:hypothetical protein